MRMSTVLLVNSNNGYVRELVLTNNQDRLVHLPAQGLRLNERDGLAVQADLALALLGMSDRRRSLLLAETRDERRRTLRFRHLCTVLFSSSLGSRFSATVSAASNVPCSICRMVRKPGGSCSPACTCAVTNQALVLCT